MIEAHKLGKKYQDKVAVDDISFTVEDGKVTGFLGPNGAGKSTTMRLMLGLDNSQGTTTYDGKLLREYPRPSQIVGILLDAKTFHPTRSARNHLHILAAAGGIAKKRVDEVLATVGLSDVAHKGPGKFSLGMSQRLGIAAALLGKPKYLLLDEPANGLGPEGIAWLRKFIKEYAAQGNAVLISSHLLSEVAQMVDNVVVIGKGKLIANTSITELVSGGKHGSVFARSPKLSALESILQANHITFEQLDGGLKIIGKKTNEIGELAFKAGIPLTELASHGASLEEVFFELTADSTEYDASSNNKETK